MSEPLIISFYTDDWEYPNHAKRLAGECIGLKLEHHIEKKESTRDYIKNTAIKPFFIRECLQRFQRSVLWLDVDGTLLKSPGLGHLDSDFAACEYFNKEKISRDWAVGIMWFNHTPAALALLDEWCDNTSRGTDEAAFDVAWKKLKSDIKAHTLPPRYHFVKWRMTLEVPKDTIFCNHLSQFEDKLRRKVNGQVKE